MIGASAYFWGALLALLSCVHGAHASSNFDFGDFLALMIGMAATAIGVLACLGAHSRKLAREQYF